MPTNCKLLSKQAAQHGGPDKKTSYYVRHTREHNPCLKSGLRLLGPGVKVSAAARERKRVEPEKNYDGTIGKRKKRGNYTPVLFVRHCGYRGRRGEEGRESVDLTKITKQLVS